MEWINLRVSTIRQPEYVGSTPSQRATWFNVLAYCIEQENGGRLADAAAWSDRQWQQTCGVTLREIRAAKPLLTFEGSDLIVWNFPHEKQEEVQAKREAGRLGGLRSGEARAKQNRSTASSSASPSASTERKGIGKEGEKEEEHTAGAREVLRTLPDSLEAPVFRDEWVRWVDYLTEKNYPRSVPSQTFDTHLRTCVRLGPFAGAQSLSKAMSLNLRAPVEDEPGSGSAKNSLRVAPAVVPFNPEQPHAHTGGLQEAT